MSTPRERPGTTVSTGSHATTHTEHSTATHVPTEAQTETMVRAVSGGDQFIRRCVLHSGPEGLRPYRMAVSSDYQFVGNTDRSPEDSGDLGYLFRSPKQFPFPKAKNGRIGETGWEMENIKGFSMSQGAFVKH